MQSKVPSPTKDIEARGAPHTEDSSLKEVTSMLIWKSVSTLEMFPSARAGKVPWLSCYTLFEWQGTYEKSSKSIPACQGLRD